MKYDSLIAATIVNIDNNRAEIKLSCDDSYVTGYCDLYVDYESFETLSNCEQYPKNVVHKVLSVDATTLVEIDDYDNVEPHNFYLTDNQIEQINEILKGV